jgi:serine/threonine protein phosphatase PrpC
MVTELPSIVSTVPQALPHNTAGLEVEARDPAPSGTMQISVAGESDVGRERQLNEDFFLVDPDLGLYVVCDGMGGHAAGEVASKTAATHVQTLLRAKKDELVKVDRGELPYERAAQILREAIEDASQTIFRMGQAEKGKKGMGTTFVSVLVRGNKGVMGHVGDSRLYLVRGGHLHQLSEDHTFLQEAIRYGMMTPEQAAQSSHHNIITRAVGPLESVIVDTLIFDILDGDTLMLCSDGLHGYLGDGNELPGVLGAGPITEMPKKLIGMANERGGQDNITSIVLRAQSISFEEKTAENKRMTLVNMKFDALSNIELFAECSMSELVRVTNAFVPREVEGDAIIIHEGEINETLFVIVEGQALVERGATAVAILHAGSHFGEMALLSQRPRSATVRAKTKCRLLALDRPQFYSLLQQDSVLATKFLWRLAQTLSLRLDDFYAFHEATTAAVGNKSTMRMGLYPSPFNHNG